MVVDDSPHLVHRDEIFGLASHQALKNSTNTEAIASAATSCV
jgi:hypothetical protein